MISQIERERLDILQQLNNLGRMLERVSPDFASDLNEGLRKVVERLAAWSAKNPRGRKRAKG